MRKLHYENQGTNTYLVYEIDEQDAVDSMSLGMLMNNRIPGLATTVITQIDNVKQIKFDVTAQVPADQYLLGTVNKKRLLGVFRGVVQAFLSAEEYMIDEGTIQLKLDNIFSNVATGETVLVCIPVIPKETDEKKDLRVFFKDILFNAQYDEQENRDYVAKIMSYLNGVPTFSLREFKELLDYVSSAPIAPQQTRPQQSPVQEISGIQQGPSVAVNKVHTTPPIATPKQADRSEVHTIPPEVSTKSQADMGSDGSKRQISLFYLLQHYNKDNAAMYKAQKEQKKAKQEGDAKKEKVPKQKKVSSQGFAVPGQKDVHSIPEADAEIASTPKATPPVQPVYQHPSPVSVQQLYQSSAGSVAPKSAQKPIHSYQMPEQKPVFNPAQQVDAGIQSSPAEPSEDTIYFSADSDDETVLLGQEAKVQQLIPHLLRKRNNEKIPINKAIFKIGRDVDYNDYAILENRYVGHGHCHIVCRAGEYFVVDDNSKNHTKVNGEIIPPGVEVKIAHGNIISVADEEFEFNLF